MVFSSLLFIFQFLPLALIIYYITPEKYKNFVLMAVSLVFYSWGEVRYFPVMLFLVIANYLCAIMVDKYSGDEKKRKLYLVVSICISIGMLFIFKYCDFFIANANKILSINIPLLNLTLPLGISFYTFQAMSYTIDVYKGKVVVERNFVNLCAYIVMFPQLIAGPIVRFSDVQASMHERRITSEQLESGMEDFVIGLARKVLIANNVGALWSEIENLGYGTISTGLAWLGILAYSLQIYFDFSGYSQMAIGLGSMLGFKFDKNFDNPYSSKSITEFWRRWHISLGTWFKEYLYIPLGGSRRGYWRTTLNLLIVWSLTGFWHGASWNFICWGLYFFILLSIEKAGFISFLNRTNVISRIYVIIALLVGWSLFAITDFGSLAVFLSRLFVPITVDNIECTVGGLYYLRNYAAVLGIGCFFSTQFSSNLYAKVRQNSVVRIVLMCILFIMCIAYLVDSTYNPFLYFRF